MWSTTEQAIRDIRSQDRVFIHSAAAAPKLLINELVHQAPRLKDVHIYQMHTEGPAPYAEPGMESSFKVCAFFVSANIRPAITRGNGSYIPVFLSEAPTLLRRREIPINVALISVSPPDKHGFCSLGSSVDISKAAVESADIVIAQVNRFMPRCHGDGIIHVSRIKHLVEGHTPLYEVPLHELNDTEKAIGKNVCALIEDGATLQMGIGAIPNAVLACLGGHKDLGIHSEMFSDGILPLVEKGIITGKYKKKHPGVIVGSFAVGTGKLYSFMDDNPSVKMLDFGYVNNADVISKNPRVTAINSAIEIDLTGQICADSIGSRIYSGVGGQMDFIRAAALSDRGKPIIALPSLTSRGESKIVPALKSGAGVVTTRAHVHYVVTEWGSVNLHGKTLEERAKLLISIAHPDHREALQAACYKC